MSLKNKKILIGLTGGIACYKVPYLIRSLVKDGAEVQVVMTRSATQFITPLTLETVSNRSVAIDMFDDPGMISTRHIDFAEWPDLIVIAPTTANFMGKVTAGICDDLLTTIICAAKKNILLAPAMNPNMWSNPVTKKNFRTLLDLGFLSIGPAEGEMACESSGIGRMSEPDEIFQEILNFFSSSKKKALKGKRILITAGPTREEIDPVRYITNHSSGKMGYAMAEAAKQMGAEVTLISGPTNLSQPSGIIVFNIISTEELQKIVLKEFKKSDCLIMAAAPADYKPAKRNSKKLKKTTEMLSMELSPTDDILKEIAKIKTKKQLTIGFALETDNGVANATKKLIEKDLDLIILNQPGPDSGFNTDTNRVTVIARNKKGVDWPLLSKKEIAHKLLEFIQKML